MANTPNPNEPFNPTSPLNASGDRTTGVRSRSGGVGWIVALIIIVLAIVAYYAFGRSRDHAVPLAETPAASSSAPVSATPVKPAEPVPAIAPAPAPAKPDPATPAN